MAEVDERAKKLAQEVFGALNEHLTSEREYLPMTYKQLIDSLAAIIIAIKGSDAAIAATIADVLTKIGQALTEGIPADDLVAALKREGEILAQQEEAELLTTFG